MPCKSHQARRFTAVRLILLFLFIAGASCALYPAAEWALPAPQSVRVLPENAPLARALPEEIENGKTDINQATAKDLEQVPGIGPVLSRQILDVRNSQGGFCFLEELMDVPNIGEKRFSALAERFYCPLPAISLP